MTPFAILIHLSLKYIKLVIKLIMMIIEISVNFNSFKAWSVLGSQFIYFYWARVPCVLSLIELLFAQQLEYAKPFQTFSFLTLVATLKGE